jgi:hypothetical protein
MINKIAIYVGKIYKAIRLLIKGGVYRELFTNCMKYFFFDGVFIFNQS